VGRFRPAAIGLDLDRGALKAVQLSGKVGGYALGHVGYHRLPPGAIAEGEVADHDLLAAELKEFWGSHSFKGRSVLLGIANQKVVVRLLDFPRMEPDDLKSAIGFEAQDHIPMPLEEAVLDHVVLGPAAEGSELDRILIVAAQREMISRYSSAARAAGLKPAGIDVKALALVRSVLPDPSGEGAVLLLDIASELTNLVIAQGGVPTLTRFVPGGSLYFAQSVAETAGIPEDEAEKQLMNPRIRVGELPPEEAEESEPEKPAEGAGEPFDPALAYDVRRGLEDAVQVLAEDVQRSVEYHYSQPGAREVGRVFVTGEGALVAGMDGYLGELLGLEARRGNPLAKLAANRSNVSDEQLGVMEPVLAVALGLAMEGE
jgi:type IV pilus assembly protein PilM